MPFYYFLLFYHLNAINIKYLIKIADLILSYLLVSVSEMCRSHEMFPSDEKLRTDPSLDLTIISKCFSQYGGIEITISFIVV